MIIIVKKNFVLEVKYGLKCFNVMNVEYIIIYNMVNDVLVVNEISYMIGNINLISYYFVVDDK